VLIRGPRIAQHEVDVTNRCARLPVTARVGPLARPRPPGTTAALTSSGTAVHAASGPSPSQPIIAAAASAEARETRCPHGNI
jgi:hypothetical protein